MESFAFEGGRTFTIIGIAEVAAGILLLLGVLRSRSGIVARVIGAIALIGFGSFFLGVRNYGEIVMTDGHMQLRVPFQRDKEIARFEIESVREIEVWRDPELRPVKKLSGGNIRDVRTGWFRLANGGRAFLAVEGGRALYLETTLGFPVMIGARDFERFEGAFRNYILDFGSAE